MRISTRLVLAATTALMLGFGAAPATATVKDGVDAWARGDYAAAIKEWRPLAESGDPDAQFNMGQAYRLGKGVPVDLGIAKSWFEKAAAQGHDKAQANLGLILFQNGERKEAMPWIQKAAQAGDARAQYVLGTALFNGDLVGKNWPLAYALMTRAAAQGLPAATDNLAEMDRYIPLDQRQQGIALAKEMEGPPSPPVVKALPPKAPRVAGQASAVKTPALAKAPQPEKPAAMAAKAPAPAPKPSAPAPKVAVGGKWRVQLGAFGSEASAREQWASISKRISALSGLQPYYEPAGKLTRLRVGPLADKAAAEKVCAAAKAAGQACFTVAP